MATGRRLVSIQGRRGSVLTLRVRAFEDAAEGLEQSVQALRRRGTSSAGRAVPINVARELLTWERLALLRAIRRERPDSLAALAKAVNRSPEQVQADLAFLEKHGIVRVTHPTARSRVKVPEFGYDEIAIRMEV
jgi:hypothetical protein